MGPPLGSNFSAEYFDLIRTPDMVCEAPVDRYLPLKPRKISERQIQLLWKNMLFKNNGMKTTKGVRVKIIKPGRFNRREGPDFRNALFLLDGEEVSGDVEIHCNAREWYEHRHHSSPYYANTVLHVFLQKGKAARPAVNIAGKELYEVELGLYLRHSMEELRLEVETGESPVSCRQERPPCRDHMLEMNIDSLHRLLNVIGEGRMLIKSNRFIDRLEKEPPDQMLYSAMLECLGHSNFKKQFAELAARLPLKALGRLLTANPGKSPELVFQAAFFTLAGFLNQGPDAEDDRELERLLKEYKGVDLPGISTMFSEEDWPLKGCRPTNHPARRLAAAARIASEFHRKIPPAIFLFRGLEGQSVPGLAVKESLAWIRSLSDPFWDHRYNFRKKSGSKKCLVGRDRAVSLLVDAAVPFFLAGSRSRHDIEEEKKLLQVYYSVPKPASNAVVDFMCRNLFGKKKPGCVGNIRHQQALLQLYKDFCHGFPSSCGSCPLPDYLSKYG